MRQNFHSFIFNTYIFSNITLLKQQILMCFQL